MNIRRLRFILESCALTQQNLDKVKEIEDIAYPNFMKGMQDIESISDVLDYAECDGEIICLIEDDWYILGCNSRKSIEIVDLASKKSLTFSDINKIVNFLKSYGDKVINVDARATTSYRLIKLLQKRGAIEIIHDSPWNWESETMHELKFKFITPNNFKEWLNLSEILNK